MARRIQLRRDTAANWSATNPTLAQGEVGIDITNNKIKIGNGSQNWNALPYFDDKETILSNYAGDIVPSTDDTYTLGTPEKRWKDVFVTEGSIYIGDVKLSNNNGTLVINRVTDGGLVTEEVVEGGTDAVQVDLTGYATEDYVDQAVGAVEIPADISDLTDTQGLLGQGGGSIAVGTGTGPSVQNVTEILINGTVTEIEPGLVGISVDGADLGNLEIDSRTILTNIDQDITIQTSYRKTITATAGAGSTMTMIVVDTSEVDDIVEVAGAGGWEVDLNSGGDTPYWKEFTAASIVGENSFAIVFTELSGDDYNYPIIEGTTYTFRKIQEDTSQWTFTDQGTLATPAGGAISHRNNDLTIAVTGETDIINLRTVGGDFVFAAEGSVQLPDGGMIAEGVVTENPTIELTPAGPDVASQKLVIKGGNAFYREANDIGLGINSVVFAVGDTITFDVYSMTNAGQTLYWWIYPEGLQGVISDPGTGTVALDEQGGYGQITFELDSDDYEFTVRVSTVENVYGEGTGVESVTINDGAGVLEPDLHHLHLTTGDLQETSIFLGTDDHNVRTKITGDIEITARDYDDEVSKRWQFKKDGELVLPEDTGGDTWAALNGPDPNEDSDTEYRAVAVGPDGAVYAGGRRDGYPTITKMEADGDIVYSKVITVLGEGPVGGRINSVEYAPVGGTPLLLVTFEIYPNYTQSVVIGLDPDTGELAGEFATAFGQADADFYITEAVTLGENSAVFVGSKNGSFVDYPVTAETGSTAGTIIVNRTDFPLGTVLYSGTSDIQISGTGFASPESFSNVNFYQGLTGTVREGSGATFIIQDNGNGTYGGSVTAAGTNYLPGHKILVLGSALGGVDTTNDAVIEVTFVGENGGVTGISITGTAAGTEVLEYTGITGTNYNVGSGLQFDLSYFSIGYANGNFGNYNGGSNYVVGDVITVPGTLLGGASPTNDMTITVNTVQGSGTINGYAIGGVAQTATWKLETPTPVDFTAEGSWTVSISYARENFLSTFVGTSIFFGLGEIGETDRLYAVATDGTDVYAIGQSYIETDDSNYNAAVLYKFSVDPETDAFTFEWARVLNEGSFDHEGKSVAVASDGVYATMVGYGEGSVTGLVKLDKTTGDILWQKGTQSGDDSSVAVDPDTGLIWVAIEGGVYDVVADDAIKLIAVDSTGAVQDLRWLARTGDDLYFKNGRCLRISGDHIVVVGYSQTENNNTPFVFRVPKAEQAEGFTEGDFLLHNAGDYEVFDLEEGFSYTVTPQIYEDTTVQPSPIDPENMFYESYDDARTVEEFGLVKSAIVFSDGTRLETAPVQERGIPQNNRSYNDYTLTLADNGKHIFHPGSNYYIYVPAHEQFALPIGYTVTLITKNDGILNIEAPTYTDINNNNYYAQIVGVGLDQQSRYWSMPQRSIATLIKVEEGLWYLSGPGLVNTD